MIPNARSISARYRIGGSITARSQHHKSTRRRSPRSIRDGAACLRGFFADWVDTIAAGIDRNMREPSALASESVRTGEPGSFFDDYCNWQRIPEFERVVRESPAAALAAQAMKSRTAQFFHDHVLVKEPGTQKRRPGIRIFPTTSSTASKR
jgi:ectoine hydroxylase-related dioxygenase (phytanoyl-CoA dioxygenase family)